jgi:anti-sigma regulatory factor (Ser/Thr protein kinase)
MTSPRPHEASMQLTPDVSSLGAGRRFVAQTLRAWEIPESRIEPVMLVANELVANAIVHAHSAPVLSLEAAGSDLLVRVADASPNLPVAREPAPHDVQGRGLVLVEALADRWGCDPTTTGKTVWVAFADAFV